MSLGMGLFSGFLTAAFTGMFLPICESLFGILLTWELPRVVECGSAGLERIGYSCSRHKSALARRRSAYRKCVPDRRHQRSFGPDRPLYHDIGKTAAPEHFVENQVGIKNPHDRLKPPQSAKIIIAHVTYGQKLAREMGLPKRIVITSSASWHTTLHYFLKKAQATAQQGEEISENTGSVIQGQSHNLRKRR